MSVSLFFRLAATFHGLVLIRTINLVVPAAGPRDLTLEAGVGRVGEFAIEGVLAHLLRAVLRVVGGGLGVEATGLVLFACACHGALAHVVQVRGQGENRRSDSERARSGSRLGNESAARRRSAQLERISARERK